MSSVELARQSMRGLEKLFAPILLFSIVMALAAFYLPNTALRVASIALQLFIYAYMAIVSDNRTLRNIGALIFITSLPIAAFNSTSSDFRSLIVPFSILGGVGCAWYSLEFKKSFFTFEIPFYLYLALTVYLIVARGYGPEEFNVFFSGIGRNGYSAILFSLSCGYVISRSVRGLRASVIILTAVFLSTFPLYGRSSIVATGVLLAATMVKRSPRFAGLIIIVGAAGLIFGYAGLEVIEELTNFKLGIASDRWAILDEYISALNPRTVVFGVPFGAVQAIVWNDGSPDLALIRLHSYLGIGLIPIAFVFFDSLWTLVRSREWLLTMVCCAVLFRAFTDIVLLFGNVDLFFIPVLFYRYFRSYWQERDAAQALQLAHA